MKRYRWLGLLLILGLVAAGCSRSDDSGNGGGTTTTKAGSAGCDGVALQATDTGVTADTITIQVMADTGSPLAPGLFQGNVDAVKGFEKYINANGGLGCRQLKVETWDSKLDPTETKNGQINACQTALAMVGGNSLFNPDVSEMNTCADSKGQAIGLANIAALANDINEQCSNNSFIIQGIAEDCPASGAPPTGKRTQTALIGPTQWYQQNVEPNLVGLYLVPGDLPTTVQSATTQIAAQESIGVKWIGALKVSGRDEQSAYTPKVQTASANNANYVYDGSNDVAMMKMRAEAKAQNLQNIKVWGCSLACYTDKFKAAGSDVDGTYAWMQFIPFEEKGSNDELDNYLASVATPDSFGAQAWMAAVLLQDAVNDIVQKDGPNAITRQSLLAALNGISSFDAHGWMGAKDPKGGFSDCYVMLQVENGEFVRKFPADKGTLSCDAKYLTQVTIDPAVEAQKIQ